MQSTLIPYTMTSASVAMVKAGHHWADIYQWNAPLKPRNFRVVLWWKLGIEAVEEIDGARSFDEAHRYASKRLSERLAAESAEQETNPDEQAGYDAHGRIWGRLMDALRGTKGYPDMPRCPYRRADRVEAWDRGLNRAHIEALKSFYDDMDEEED